MQLGEWAIETMGIPAPPIDYWEPGSVEATEPLQQITGFRASGLDFGRLTLGSWNRNDNGDFQLLRGVGWGPRPEALEPRILKPWVNKPCTKETLKHLRSQAPHPAS